MTLSPRKRERLSAFLGELPVAAAVKLFSALEIDRAVGGKGIPHNAVLEDLRQRIASRSASLPARPQNAKRSFFEPFEDYFISIRTGKKRRAQIARTSLEPIWRLMMTDPTLTEAAMAAAALDDAYRAGAEADGLLASLYLAAEAGLGRLFSRAQANSEFETELISELGGEGAFFDLEELRHLLPAIDILKDLRAVVPSSSPSLNEEQFFHLRKLFLSAHEQSPFLGSYVLLALKGRLEAPWRALGVYYHLARSADEQLHDARDAVMALPESLFEDIEELARALERACALPLDAQSAMARISYFAEYADGLMRQATRTGDNVFVNRIEACRDIASEAHARFMELALANMRDALPVRRAGGSSRLAPPRPDFARPLAPEIVNDAKSAVELIVAAPLDARRLGDDPVNAQSITDGAHDQAKTYANDLVAEIRAAEGNDRAAARRLLDQTLSVIGPLLKSDEAGLIRDRAAAAAVTV
ncbi:hypothetical protein [Hyphococcus lacteus]|uniref:Uncharacterized protein n=1 Tax=Hyphococcus lacteus TaxID=3143536 RepID=A0ABV3Z1K9_9PROT